MEKQRTLEFYRKRQALTFLPMITVPLLAGFFFLMHGGTAVQTPEQAAGQVVATGINMSIPEADPEKIAETTLKAYDQVVADSIKRLKNDKTSYLDRVDLDDILSDSSTAGIGLPGAGGPATPSALNVDINHSALAARELPEQQALQEVERELKAVQEVERTGGYAGGGSGNRGYAGGGSGGGRRPVSKAEAYEQQMMEDAARNQRRIDELMELSKQQLLAAQKNSGAAPGVDAEEAVGNTAPAGPKRKVKKLEVKVITPAAGNGYRPAMDSAELAAEPAGFYSVGSVPTVAESANVIMAVIHESSTVMDGATVKLRLKNAISVSGILIPAGSFVSGPCQINGERMKIAISSIRYREMVLPVSLSVYDTDGLPGLYTPGSLARNSARQGATRGLGGNFIGTSPTVESQLTQVGVETVRNFLTKQANTVKVHVKANYQVLLKPTDNEE